MTPLRARLIGAGAAGTLAIATAIVGYFEGRSLVAYVDPVGIPTICDGWTHGVRIGDRATEQECDEYTRQALLDAEAIFNAWVPKHTVQSMPPSAKAAFLSFIYNVGPGGAGVKDGFVYLKSGRHSTMLQKLRADDIVAACRQLPNWTKAGGRELRGLVLRRQAEMDLCLSDL